ncbi:MAG: right-handed parallel beta-helix repeat-containing protein [Candidatus Hodarchaeota archaeon]
MKRNNIAYITLSFIFLGIIILSGMNAAQVQDNVDTAGAGNEPLGIHASLIHSKILIMNDTDLAAFPDFTSGNGTESNPYVIEDLEIDASGVGSCIEIRDTTKHVRIENCTLSGATQTDRAGIQLSNCSNITIKENQMSASRSGVYLHDGCTDVNITTNPISATWTAIYLDGSAGNVIEYNTMSSGWMGIYMCTNSDANIVMNNTISAAPYAGCAVTECADSVISNNTIINAEKGIRVIDSPRTNILFNNISGCAEEGIYLQSFCGDSNVTSNILTNNGVSGGTDNVYLRQSDGTTVTGNTIIGRGFSFYSNGVEGFYFDDTNTVNGKVFYHYANKTGLLPEDFVDAGQIVLANCNSSIISNLEIHLGMMLFQSHGNIVENNSISRIFLRNSDYNTITGNRFTYLGPVLETDHIYLLYSSFNIISENVIDVGSGTTLGIKLRLQCKSNLVTKNLIKSLNGYEFAGINLDECDTGSTDYNTVSNNFICGFDFGMYEQMSSMTLVENNHIWNYSTMVLFLESSSDTGTINNGNSDGDADGLSDQGEVLANSLPWVPDTDGDGVLDGAEVSAGSDPTVTDTDGDGIDDAMEINLLGTDPGSNDTDGDGLLDADEVVIHRTSPVLEDTDGDGILDGVEVQSGTNPLDPSDPDSGTPGFEVIWYLLAASAVTIGIIAYMMKKAGKRSARAPTGT